MAADALGVAAAARRLGGEDVVEPGDVALDDGQAGGDDVASFVFRKHRVVRDRRLADALGVRASLAGRRAARAADPVGESFGIGRFDRTGIEGIGASAVNASSDARTITRVSSTRTMPRSARWRSSPAGCENGVMRTYG